MESILQLSNPYRHNSSCIARPPARLTLFLRSFLFSPLLSYRSVLLVLFCFGGPTVHVVVVICRGSLRAALDRPALPWL